MSKRILMGSVSPSSFDAFVDEEVATATQATQVRSWTEVQRSLLSLRVELLPHQAQALTRVGKDGRPVKRKVVSTSRRSGKTYFTRHEVAEKVAFSSWADTRKAQPVVQYIAPTQKKCIDLFWTPFKNICARVGMDAHWDDSNLRAQFSNGVLVRAAGVDTGFDIEKYRGDAYVHAALDEAASYGSKVKALIVEGLGMAMGDYGGSITITGTPGKTMSGYFYRALKGLEPGWHAEPCWSFMDNYHLPAEMRSWNWVKENLGALDSPRVRREAFGEWVTDASTLVYYGYEAQRNSAPGLPAGHEWKFILGCDFGWRDDTAFVVVAYAKTHPHLFVVLAESAPHMLPDDIFARIAQLKQQYALSRIVADLSGSTTKGLVTQWNRRSGLGIVGAAKAPNYKNSAIGFVNADLHNGRVRLLPGAQKLADEWAVLPWDDDKEDEDAEFERHDGASKEHAGFPNHNSDAFLYAHMEARHYRNSKIEEPAPVGSPQYFNQRMLEAKQRAILQMTQAKRGWKYGKLV